MSVSVIACLRPAPGRCLHHATTGLLSIRLQTRTTSLQMRAIVPLPTAQRRYQSRTEFRTRSEKEPEQPKLSFRQFLGRALVASLRKLGYAFTPNAIRQAYREYPYSTVFSFVIFFCAVVSCTYVALVFYNTFYNKEFSAFPEPIANTLRRALHASIIRPDPELAQKMYKKALQQAAEMRLDPLSDEVLGIKIRIAAWLESIDSHEGAAKTLEIVLADCLQWIDIMEQAVKDGKINEEGKFVSDLKTLPDLLKKGASPGPEGEEVVENSAADEPPAEDMWHKRQRLLLKAISTSVKLGELYADEHILDGDKSHERLVWAVEQSLKEFHRRRVQGSKPGEDHWMTPAELGGSIESLARDYERKSQYQYVIPLYFHALRLCEVPCHRVVIMNNLSAAFAQHPVYSPGTTAQPNDVLQELFKDPMPRSREECLEAAENWARNAYKHAVDVKGDDRTPECDSACAVALCNWGDVAAMLGKTGVARKRYKQCVEMSTKLDFAEGVKRAKEGLSKLTSTPDDVV